MPAPGGGLVPGGCLLPGGSDPGGVPAQGGGLVQGVPAPGGACSRWGAWWRPPRWLTAAGSTYPTGMYSCLNYDTVMTYICYKHLKSLYSCTTFHLWFL